MTDRYTKAIEQLGSDKLDVRLGGVYALERVARDSARGDPAVMEVVAVFIREHSHDQWPPHGARPDLPSRGPVRICSPPSLLSAGGTLHTTARELTWTTQT